MFSFFLLDDYFAGQCARLFRARCIKPVCVRLLRIDGTLYVQPLSHHVTKCRSACGSSVNDTLSKHQCGSEPATEYVALLKGILQPLGPHGGSVADKPCCRLKAACAKTDCAIKLSMYMIPESLLQCASAKGSSGTLHASLL